METPTKPTTPSKIPKCSGIPRPRSKSGERTLAAGKRSRSFSESESRSRSVPVPRDNVKMSDPRYYNNNNQSTPQQQQNHAENDGGHHDNTYNNNNSNTTREQYENNYSSIPPNNNIPRYQGLINSKFRQGILTSQQNSPLIDSTRIVSSHNNNHHVQEDIASMFQRPNNAIPPSPVPPIAISGNGWGAMDNSHVKYPTTTTANSGYGKDLQSKTISPNDNNNKVSFIGIKNSYSTADELDKILAKYKTTPQPHHQQQYQVYPLTIQPNYSHQMEPSHSNNYQSNPGVEYHSHNNISNQHSGNNSGRGENYATNKSSNKPIVDHSDNQQRQHQHHINETMPIHEPKENLGVFGLPLDSNNYRTQKLTSSLKKGGVTRNEDHLKTLGKVVNGNAKQTQHAQHKFPFKENADGDLLVHPDQVAFESKAVSVLVSDPTKIWNASKADKIHDLRNQDSLLKEVEDVITKGLNRFYDVKDDTQRSIENAYLDKEVIEMKYSNSNTGTDKLMSEIHRRLVSGRHADTHIIIGQKIYPCHSMALEVESTYFDNMTQRKESLRRVELPEAEVPATIFPTLMDWILQNNQGRAAAINKTNVIQLFSCGKYLGISDLKSQCVNYLHEKVETNDPQLMALWDEVKKRPSCKELMVVVSAKAALSFQHIFKAKKFLNLEVDELVMLLSSDDIVIESELDVFDTAVQWVLHNWETRKVVTNEVISTVRFGLLTPLQLTQIAHSPELAKGLKVPHEYHELLAFGSVKNMIDDGLAFSIVFESYKTQPEEIKSWVETTGIKAPRPRNHTNPKGKSKIFTVPQDAATAASTSGLNATGSVLNLHRRPSYTVSKQPDLPNDSNSKTSYKLHNSTKRSVLDIFENTVKDSSQSRAVHSLGQPIREEDIKNLGPSTSTGNSRSRSVSRDKYTLS